MTDGSQVTMQTGEYSCDLCGASEYVHLATKPATEWDAVRGFRETHGLDIEDIPRSFSLVQCTDCCLVSVFPAPPIELLNRFYEDYLSGMYDSVLPKYDEEFAAQRSVAYLRRISDVVPAGVVLDVGCATGGLMRMALTMGYRADGVEVSATAARKASSFGAVYQGSLLDLKETLPSNHYDIVTSIDSLEHFSRPVTALRLIRAVMRRGGLLFIETPNQQAGYDEMSRHLHLFNETTLRRALEEAGFGDIRTRLTDTRYNPSDPATEGRFVEAIAVKLP